MDRARFLEEDAYCPLPTLVEAARELMKSGTLRRIERAHASTRDAVDAISAIIHEAARTKTRRLILLTGLPGSGKTLVGLQTVHAHYLDDLAIARAGAKLEDCVTEFGALGLELDETYDYFVGAGFRRLARA